MRRLSNLMSKVRSTVERAVNDKNNLLRNCNEKSFRSHKRGFATTEKTKCAPLITKYFKKQTTMNV